MHGPFQHASSPVCMCDYVHVSLCTPVLLTWTQAGASGGRAAEAGRAEKGHGVPHARGNDPSSFLKPAGTGT